MGPMHFLSGRHAIRLTEVRSPPLVPEIGLHLYPAHLGFEAFRNLPALADGPAPFWARAWPGGQALARLVLDRPELVRGRHVVDVGGGSALAAIAAARAGCLTSATLDRDPAAAFAARMNARLNGVTIDICCGEIGRGDVDAVSIVLAGDMWYERRDAMTVTAWLRDAAGRGATVLCGDCKRSYFPRSGLQELASYHRPDSQSQPWGADETWGVWQML